MRKVNLNMKAQEKYKIIKLLVEKGGNKLRAAQKIGCTTRTINRLIIRYKTLGKEGFLHGNTNRQPTHTLSPSLKAEIVSIYNKKYWDTNFTYASELLSRYDDINVSPTTLRKILMNEYITSPRATRKTVRAVTKALKQKQKKCPSKKEKQKIETALLSIVDAHARRPRCSYFGEMLQMDASMHLWFGKTKAHLHIAIDDATGKILGAFFDTQETLNGYYNVLYQILNGYGIPAMFYTDNRTVFEYKLKKQKKPENNTYTQFSYACNQLGIDIKTTSIPQAKGRVERSFQTLQARLPVELRLAEIKTLSEANIFLNSYIKEYNAKFSLPLNNIKSVFETQPDPDSIDQTLAVLTERKIDNGHCIRYKNNYYKLIDRQGLPVYYHKGITGLVIQTFHNQLLFSTNSKVYMLDEIPLHEHTSKNFDIQPLVQKPKKRNIPKPRHPWRNRSFWCHIHKNDRELFGNQI